MLSIFRFGFIINLNINLLFSVCFEISELSIPTLSSIVKRDEDKLNMFRALKTKQIRIEENAIQRSYLADEKPLAECKPEE